MVKGKHLGPNRHAASLSVLQREDPQSKRQETEGLSGRGLGKGPGKAGFELSIQKVRRLRESIPEIDNGQLKGHPDGIRPGWPPWWIRLCWAVKGSDFSTGRREGE